MSVPRRLRLSSILLLAFASAAASADPALPLDRFSLSAGGFHAKPEVQFVADTEYGSVDTPNEKSDRRTLPNARATFLIGDRHQISADYLRYSNAYRTNLAEGTVIDGESVFATANFDGKIKYDVSKVAYMYWFGQEKTVFGVGLGAAHYRARASGTASATIVGDVGGVPTNRTVSGSDSTEESTTLPLLELGFKHAFSDTLRLTADASGVKKNGGSVHGKVYGGKVGIEWMALKNVGLVLDYGMQKIDLNRGGDERAELKIKLSGPSAFVKMAF
jgi:hypothetical protein